MVITDHHSASSSYQVQPVLLRLYALVSDESSLHSMNTCRSLGKYHLSYYLLTTSFQPSSCLLPFLGLGKVDTLVVAVVVVRVTARHWAAAVATVIGESAL